MVVIQHLLVLFLVIGIPVWDHFETKRLKGTKNLKAKVQSYKMAVATLWLLTIIAFLSTPDKAALFSLPESFLNFESEFASFIKGMSVSMILAISLGSMLPIILLRFRPQNAGVYKKQFESLAFFLPNTTTERWWFVLVSISAGFCEEIVYRSYLYRYFTESPWMFVFWLGLVLACLVFAIAHGYQGITGILSTFVLAAFMFILWYSFGTLWIPIIAHILFDLRILLLPDLRS